MGTHYAIYAEVRVGDKWYNLNPLFQRADGKIDVCPVISGRNWLRETYEEMEEDRYAYGRPEDMSQEVRTVFYHEDDEPYDPYLHINTYKDFYNRSIFLVNYGKAIKSRVKKDNAATGVSAIMAWCDDHFDEIALARDIGTEEPEEETMMLQM